MPTVRLFSKQLSARECKKYANGIKHYFLVNFLNNVNPN